MFVILHKICGPKSKHEVHSEAFSNVEDAMKFCKDIATQLLEPDDELVDRKTVLSKPGYCIVNNLQIKHKFTIHRINGVDDEKG